MERGKSERVRSYLELIAGKEGLERILDEELASRGALEGLEATESPAAGAARAGLESMAGERELDPDEAEGLEALIIPKLRPAIDVVDGKFESTHRLWKHLSSDAAIRGRLEAVMSSIGRIELPGHSRFPYGGTGFVAGDGLLMTNRHVAEIFANGLGNRSLAFKPGHRAGIDFLRERDRPPGTTLMVRRVVMIHPYWDMAILAVEGLGAERKPLKLSTTDISGFDRHQIAIIGYPSFDPRNNAEEQDELFDGTYGIKRLQPGELHRRTGTESFGKIVSAAAHDCSTLGGMSGSGVVDLATGEVVALHFGGRYQAANFAVPMFELARDGRVVDAGLNFAGTASGGTPPWSDWWEKADMTEAAKPAGDASAPAANSGAQGDGGGRKSLAVQATGDGVTIEIPLHITVRLGAPGAPIVQAKAAEAVTESAGEGLEGLAEPFRDTRYTTRKGYDDNFLGVKVPMPAPKDASVLARTRDGGAVVHYEHFSILMHGKRRLALVTASNVVADPRLKKPEPGQDYTRKGLSGLGENDQEKWFVDPRLDDGLQLPDAFFTKDRKAFDKGHIIRREDVAWGKTYAELRRANGDTYHVTNCSPQTAEFNRSANGVENWGDLENRVLTGAAQERLVLFAGPVLKASDRVFHGTGGGGTKILAKIPVKFWKIIVAPLQDGVAAFGFVLEQDLSNVAFEYAVSDEFVAHMYRLTDIQKMTGVELPNIVLDADQYDSVSGAELAFAAGTPRKTLED